MTMALMVSTLVRVMPMYNARNMIQGVMFLFVMALLLFGFTKAFGGNIMRLLVSSESIYEGTMDFLDWRIYGFFFSFINVMFRALYIGITRTKVLTINAIASRYDNLRTGTESECDGEYTYIK